MTSSRTDSGSFGFSLRTRRLQAGLTQEELADRTTLSGRTIANIETGRVRRPHRHSIRTLADALNLTGVDRAEFEQASRRWSSSGVAGGLAPSPNGPSRQLPAALHDLVGRREPVLALVRHLVRDDGVGPAVAAISGPGGVGKSTIAVHVAHVVSADFPDGQLFLDLGGVDEPVQPRDALGHLLRALGLDGARMPGDARERSALYRSTIAGKRILIVLDGAVDEAHVRPLLPGTSGCAVLVTARKRLDALDRAKIVELGALAPAESLDVLRRLIGYERVSADERAAAAIVQNCGGLALALRIAGARLAARADLPLAAFARTISDERHRLEHLRFGDLEVRARIGTGYGALAESDRRAFRLLGLVRLGSFSAWALAPLLEMGLHDAGETAERLAEGGLLEVVGIGPDDLPRYRFHDLVRLYAAERLAEEETDSSRKAAVGRALGGWLAFAEAVTASLPSVHDVPAVGAAPRWSMPGSLRRAITAEPSRWFGVERFNVAAAVDAAVAYRLHDLARQIGAMSASPCLALTRVPARHR